MWRFRLKSDGKTVHGWRECETALAVILAAQPELWEVILS